MEGSDFEETSRSTRTGSASHVPPGDWSRDNFEQEESELPSSSGRPTNRARRNILDDYGGRQNEHLLGSLQLDEVKHKVFLSHSGAQEDFAEQLCADLERRGFIATFFDQRHHSLPKGKDFMPLIREAARHCHVAVIVLSEEFLCSKWPMIELAEFHAAQQAGNRGLNILPLFYKLFVQDLGEMAIEERWMPTWRHLVNNDARIEVAKWSEAVRALRTVNGVVFGQKGLSEVDYRKDIVQSIFKLSPPDMLYGSSHEMVGYSRLCKRVCDRFVRGTSGGPSFLGLYGMSGAGKTTLSKALCDHFYGEYMGRVCHVDLGETPIMGRASHVDLTEMLRLRRVKRMLERLCGLDKEVLDRISDFDEGLTEMQSRMKREPVFLAFDNVTNHGSSWDETHKYLSVGFHPLSRIVITSRSRWNIGGLVPHIQFCVPIPRLSVMEAGELFLRSVAPSKSIFGLTAEEQRIVGLCIQQCLFDAEEDQVGYDSGEDEVGLLVDGDVSKARWKSYHPVALSELGDFFRRNFCRDGILDLLEGSKESLWDLWKVPPGESSRNNLEQEESELPSSSGRPSRRARRDMLDHYGGRQNEDHFGSLQLDEVKHTIFLSHSGVQKDFAEQLCVDLERVGFTAPFFDQRHHSLPKGKGFVPLIIEAARHCHVAVVVLSEEYLCSKWPMIELAVFHGAKLAGNQQLNMLPLFYKLSVEDLGERSIEDRWMPIWEQFAIRDNRIDVENWSDAVRALRKVNGLIFGKWGLSELGYRKDIVRSIFKLSPPDMLYGSSRKMVGYCRLCERVCDRFVRGTSGGPSFLGLYGMSGAGKTTLSKALCDHFYGEYMGRVCHVDLGETPIMGRASHMDVTETSRLRRVKQMLERLCGLDKEVLDRISDFDEGLMLMQMHMKREPVFLAFDNVMSDDSSWNETHKYLSVGFHPESRIVITSRSRSNIGDLVPNVQLCVRMPRLSVMEAGELFLRSAATSKSIFGLTVEEQRIVGLCIKQCLFFDVEEDQVLYDSSEDEVEFFDVEEDQVMYDSSEDEVELLVEGDVSNARWKSYHPLALSALGDFFRRYFSDR